MLYSQSRVNNILEAFGILAKQVLSKHRMRMHRCDIKQSDVIMHSWLSIHKTTFSRILPFIYALTAHNLIVAVPLSVDPFFAVLVTWKADNIICTISPLTSSQVSIDKFRLLIVAKYNRCCMSSITLVDSQTAQLTQDLSGFDVFLDLIPDSFGSQHIITAIISDKSPLVLRNLFIPFHPKLLMSDQFALRSQLDLPLLQALLLCSNIINISI